MRLPLIAALLGLLLAASGCRDRRDMGYEFSTGESAMSASPEMREYVLLSQRGYYFLAQAKSYRRVSDQPRGDKILHSEMELSCPDRFHLKVSGATDYERYVIGDQMYERRGAGTWTRTTLQPPVADLMACRANAYTTRRRPPDEADIEMMLPMYREMTAKKRGLRTYHGIECQEYVHQWQGGPEVTTCFATQGQPYPIHSGGRYMTSDEFDFNKPIKIEPPKID